MGLITGLVSWSIQGFAFFFILHSLGFETSIAIAMGIYALSLLAGAASFIPGGIGSTELVMGLLLSASGADNAIAITAPLISRLSTLWFAVAVGFIATGILSACCETNKMRHYRIGTIINATILIILINGLIAGPAVSL